MDIRNAKAIADGVIDVEVNHPDFGWVPFTAVEGSDDPVVSEVWAQIQNGEAGEVAPADPVVTPVPQTITALQFIIWLVASGWITQDEGNAWLDGTLPQAMNDLLNAIPEEQRFAARARALKSTMIARNDPLITALAAMHNRSPEEVDQFFIDAEQL